MLKKIKLSPELRFLVVALILAALFLAIVVFSLKFLVNRLNLALGLRDLETEAEVVGFDLKGFQDLKLGE